MKRITAIIIATVILGLVGCDGPTGSPGITENEILLGNVQDLSGPMKELGKLLPSGSNLYFDYVNQGGGVHGRKIRMLVEDGQYNPQKTVAAVKKLIEM
ncbi:MAG: ABC transporter substrate-binding protein, partial [Candidatus Marinimicrobia bacterium]|nr:ABC transporter substrate-binding protein [Candidatus Neomarinimicrobiota bacterium]